MSLNEPSSDPSTSDPRASDPPETDPPTSHDAPSARAILALTRAQTSRPFTLLLIALLTVALSGLLAGRLKLKTALGELLPANKESVVVAEQVSKRLIASSTLFIVAEGRDSEALKRFVDALAPALRALPEGQIGAVDDGVRESRAFFEKNAALYAPLEDVQKIHDEIIDRYEAEVRRRAGLDLGLDDDDEKRADPASADAGSADKAPITADTIRAKIAERKDPLKERFPEGYYLEKGGQLITILVRTPVSPGDLEKSNALLTTIQGVIDSVDPKRFDPAMTVRFTGNIITGIEEYSQIKGDLSHVGLYGVAMILGVVFLFYLRLRALLALTLSVGIGTAWTFGAAYLLVGSLNSSTGFLVSIIVGNGINFGIIYMARYMEARRAGAVFEAALVAHKETWLATLSAAGAAMVAYGSLVVTDFRGFKHFGAIGGSGMILCWIATYLFLPAILAASERVYPLKPDVGVAARLRAGYGRPFAFLAERAPRVITVTAAALAIGAAALAVRYVAADPMEYDMSKTRTEPKTGQSEARKLMGRVDNVVGRQGQEGLAIMVDRIEQVRPLREALLAKRDAAPSGHKPFEKVADIFDLLPQDQDKKIELIEEARDRLDRAKKRGLIADKDWAEIERFVPPGELKPIGVADLPEQAARMFTERDGTRGRLVYIVPTKGRSVWDGRYLIEWAASFRSTTLPDGSVVKGSGGAVIFADVLLAVVEDAPKAIVVSLIGTLLIVFLAFRGRAAALVVTATLCVGLVWMLAALALYDVHVKPSDGALLDVNLVGLKLNFLNFISLPITVGVGADYALNVMQRYRIAGPDRIHDVVVETGGAVILCSLTTALGYFALTLSVNRAIQSFGYAAAAGEVSCLIAAVLVLPAFLLWARRRFV